MASSNGRATLAVVAIVGTMLTAAAHKHGSTASASTSGSSSGGGAVATLEGILGSVHLGSPGSAAGAAGKAIAYALAQRGKPYLWGGIGPDEFDCSGLVMQAYASAGVSIPRTSEAQWAWGVAGGKTVSWADREPGDLVFFPGSDGTPQAPGHVVMLVSRSSAIQAYASGVPIGITPVAWGESGAVVGVVRPTAGG